MRFILCLIFTGFIFGQSYSELINKAWKSYEEKKYIESGDFYLKAFQTMSSENGMSQKNIGDRFNAACTLALANNSDQSFHQLMIIAKSGKYTNLDHIKGDSDLKSLHSNSRWKTVINLVEANFERIKPVSIDELKLIYVNLKKAQDNVFRKGSSISDIDKLYSFYTSDFEYNHPKYGGIYTRKHLYDNTVASLKRGRYNNSKKRTTVNIIYGENAICIEQQYEGDDKTTMTLFKFRKNKIYYTHEFW